MTALILAIIATGISGIDDRKTIATEWGWVEEAVILNGLNIKQGITVGEIETHKSFDGRSIINRHRNQSYFRFGDFAIEVIFQLRTIEKP